MDKWIPGKIVTKLGDLHYEIDYTGKRFKRHIDQIRTFLGNEPECSTNVYSAQKEKTQFSSSRRVHFYGDRAETTSSEAISSTAPSPQSKMSKSPTTPAHSTIRSQESSPNQFFTPPTVPRRSTRIRRPPNRFVQR
ncbi:hypothetical protein ALC60_08475 [Trachymyrmex zeteki]|uniref:Uncharacterized protein n=1 Tax=Mycetomoellerius zeteki TaxID=64791 RepID=A0A151WWU0_9HYME|nr:hypothetical protein ALC60_08475 [Trachymyrmex zeteki]